MSWWVVVYEGFYVSPSSERHVGQLRTDHNESSLDIEWNDLLTSESAHKSSTD